MASEPHPGRFPAHDLVADFAGNGQRLAFPAAASANHAQANRLVLYRSDAAGRVDRNSLEPMARVGFACESLKVTTRIMHIVAWLLTQRAVESGEISASGGRRPERRLGNAQDSDPDAIAKLPESARKLISSSIDLYARIKRLDEGVIAEEPPQSPARALMGRLERGLGGQL